MSAPDTDIDTQKKRHLGPRMGIVITVALAVLGLGVLLTVISANSDDEAAPAAVAPQ